MRTALLSLFVTLTVAASAQCTFDATVTPNDLILCPNANGVLTTQVYDSYQWYKDGSPIAGATGQTLPVQQFNDAGSQFSVNVTLDGCTEMSDVVLVDGWVFLLPYVINGGDEPNGTGPNGELLFCHGDTLTLELGQPYTTNITWYSSGNPIPGETGNILTVTSTGSYTCSGAPEICPNFMQQLGVDIEATFVEPTQPTIDIVDDQLCATPAGDSYQWYLNDEPFAGNTPCIPLGGGAYSVYVDYGEDCQIISQTLIVEGVEETNGPAFSVAPNPASAAVRITWPAQAQPRGTWAMMDMAGRAVRRGAFGNTGSVWVETRELPVGRYLFTAVDDAGWAPVSVSVAR